MTVWDSANVVVILFRIPERVYSATARYAPRQTAGTFCEFFDGTEKKGFDFFFHCVGLRLILIGVDFNEGGGRGEPLSRSNFVSSLLSDQPLAVAEHSLGLESSCT